MDIFEHFNTNLTEFAVYGDVINWMLHVHVHVCGWKG